MGEVWYGVESGGGGGGAGPGSGAWKIADFVFKEPDDPTTIPAFVLADVAPTLPLTVAEIYASVTADAAPTVPLTITMGINDTFNYTNVFVGTPDLYTIAPGIYATAADVATAMGAAVDGSSQPFSALGTPVVMGGKLFIQNGQFFHNGDTITEGDGGAAACGFTGNPDTFAGELLNDQFVYTPVSTGISETFSIPTATYTTLVECATAMGAAIGESAEAFSTLVTVSVSGGKLLLTAIGGGATHNGDIITDENGGTNAGASAMGFTGNPDTFAGGTDQTLTAKWAVPAGATVMDVLAFALVGPWADSPDAILNVADTTLNNWLNNDGLHDPSPANNVAVTYAPPDVVMNAGSGGNMVISSAIGSGNYYSPGLIPNITYGAGYGAGPGVLYPSGDTITMTVSGIAIGGGGGKLLVRIIYIEPITPVIAT